MTNRPKRFSEYQTVVVVILVAIFGLASCATKSTKIEAEDAAVSRTEQQAAQDAQDQPATVMLKRKVAIGRFTNETRYGRTFFRDADLDPLGKQASDMLATSLIESNQFLVFERPDLTKIEAEQLILGESELIGVDALILGSLTEFGRKTTGEKGFLSSTKLQTARAVVVIRLVDAKTGYAFFSASGGGEASMESGEIAGFGSQADYDETLNGKAISAAISDVIGELINKLEERPWKADILQIEGELLYLAGVERQGIKVGDVFSVMLEGDTVRSSTSGANIQLPASRIGQVEIITLFGDSEINEGAVAKIISGDFSGDLQKYFITQL